MTRVIDRTSALLATLSTAIGSLLGSRRWELMTPAIAADLGAALGASGVAVCACTALTQHTAAHGHRTLWPTPPPAALHQLLHACHHCAEIRTQLGAGNPVLTISADGAQALLVPIMSGGALWGALTCVAEPDAERWPPEYTDVLVALAALFGSTISQHAQAAAQAGASQLTRQLLEVELVRLAPQQPRAEYQTMLQLTEELLHAADAASVLRRAIEHVSRELEFERAALFLVEGDALRALYFGGGAETISGPHNIRIPSAEFDATYRQVTYTDASFTIVDGPHFQFTNGTLSVSGYGNSVLTPIRAPTGQLGLLVNDNARSGQPIALGRQRLLSTYCALLGTILERAYGNQRLHASERRYRTLAETTPDGVALLDPSGRITLCNHALVQILGYPDQQLLIGVLADTLVVEERAGATHRFLQLLERATEVQIAETEVYRYDGTRLLIEIAARSLYEHTNQIEGYVIVVHDLTRRSRERGKLESAFNQLRSLNSDLIRSRDLLRTLFDALDDGLLLLDTDGWVLASNNALARLVARPVEETISVEWLAICQAIDPLLDGGWILQTLSDGVPRARRQRISRPGGAQRMLDIQTFPLAGVNQPAEQLIVRISDVTEQLRLEAQLIEQERFATSGRLVATVAHEINTPLQSIQAALYLIGNGSQDQRTSYLELAQREIERIASIVRQLLDVYRPAPPAPVAINLQRLIDQVLMLIDHRLAEARVTVRREHTPVTGTLLGRPDQLTQLLINLFVNAIQAMPNGGELVIRTFGTPGSIVLAVTDSGVGIPAERQSQIFEPFYSTKPDGTGLGLAVTTQIVQEHGGTIAVQSDVGAGSTFTIALPIAEQTKMQGR